VDFIHYLNGKEQLNFLWKLGGETRITSHFLSARFYEEVPLRMQVINLLARILLMTLFWAWCAAAALMMLYTKRL
jgi:hypothetical protein